MNIEIPTPPSPAEIRKLRGEMSQEEFARIIGVSWQTVHNWETGKTTPKGLFLIRLLEVKKAIEVRGG